MYDKNGKLIDRREMLRVKVKSLAAEASIIRHAEGKTKGVIREELHLHRVKDLAQHARTAHIALALLKGHPYEKIENKAYTAPDWTGIERLVAKYGPQPRFISVKAIMASFKLAQRGPRKVKTRPSAGTASQVGLVA